MTPTSKRLSAPSVALQHMLGDVQMFASAVPAMFAPCYRHYIAAQQRIFRDVFPHGMVSGVTVFAGTMRGPCEHGRELPVCGNSGILLHIRFNLLLGKIASLSRLYIVNERMV